MNYAVTTFINDLFEARHFSDFNAACEHAEWLHNTGAKHVRLLGKDSNTQSYEVLHAYTTELQ